MRCHTSWSSTSPMHLFISLSLNAPTFQGKLQPPKQPLQQHSISHIPHRKRLNTELASNFISANTLLRVTARCAACEQMPFSNASTSLRFSKKKLDRKVSDESRFRVQIPSKSIISFLRVWMSDGT